MIQARAYISFAAAAVVCILACSPASVSNGSLTIFAAASLTDTFQDIGAAFQAKHSNVHISFNFAASSTLRSQIEQGAKADLFASADTRQTDLLYRSNAIFPLQKIFTSNSLVLVVSEHSEMVRSPADLANPEVLLALALPEVPAGKYALEVLEQMSVSDEFGRSFYQKALANVATYEVNVRQVLAKVALGEVDAGIVYLSDVTGGRDEGIKVIRLVRSHNVTALYPIAILIDTHDVELAEQFVNFLISQRAQAILAEHGFQEVLS